MSRDTLMIKRLKKNYTYKASQLHQKFGVHPRTLSDWHKKSALPLIKNRPMMVFSEELRAFLTKRMKKRRSTLKLTEFYCLGTCKAPRQAYEGKVHLEDLGSILQVKAVCPYCGAILNRRHNKKKYEAVTPLMRAISLADLHILQHTIKSEKTHLAEATNNTPNEPSMDTHLFKAQKLL